MHFKKKLHIAVLILCIFSCDKEKSYDHSKAVLAFANTDSLKVDESLANKKITFPAQIKNHEWISSNSEINRQIENFYLNANQPKQSSGGITTRIFGGQKFLGNVTQIWSGYRPAFNDRFVFAPIVIDDQIFLLDASGILAAYCLTSKEKLWEKRIFARKFLKNYQTPRIGYFNGKIFAIAGTNEIAAASAKDGTILWTKSILSIPVSTPISDGKFVYVTTNDNKTYALNAENGKLEWVSSGVVKTTAILGAASPLFYKDQLIVSYSSGEIYALNKGNGEILWSQDLNLNKAINSDFYLNDVDATPIIKGDSIFALGNGGLMMSIDAKTGNYLWKKEIAGIADFWSAGGFLFIINNEDKLIAFEQKSGAIKWVKQLPDFTNAKKPETKIIYSGLILAGDRLIITDSRGRVLVANPQNGEIEQTLKLNYKLQHSPIVVDGKIFLHAMGKFTVELIEIN